MARGEAVLEISSISFCWYPSSPSKSRSKFKSLALRDAISLLLGSCKEGGVAKLPGWFIQAVAAPKPDEADGDMPDPVCCIIIKAVAISNDDSPDDDDFGEESTIPATEAAEGLTERSSSGLWAKKQTRRLQPVSSLQRRVRYWSGWSQLSNTPWAYSQASPFRHDPLRNSGQGTQL